MTREVQHILVDITLGYALGPLDGNREVDFAKRWEYSEDRHEFLIRLAEEHRDMRGHMQDYQQAVDGLEPLVLEIAGQIAAAAFRDQKVTGTVPVTDGRIVVQQQVTKSADKLSYQQILWLAVSRSK